MRRIFLAAFSLSLALSVPASAQGLQELPFDKQLKLAKVGDVDAQYVVGLWGKRFQCCYQPPIIVK